MTPGVVVAVISQFDLDLSWKLQFFAFENLGDVEIEEVTVKDCLNAAGHNCDDIVETFPVVPEDPVEDVESAVWSKGKQVVTGDRLSLSGLAHHEQLRKDRHRFQVDRKGPQDLHDRIFMI